MNTVWDGYWAGAGESRDSYGVSRLPQIQLILPYKMSCIRDSSEIPLLSLAGAGESITSDSESRILNMHGERLMMCCRDVCDPPAPDTASGSLIILGSVAVT